MPSAPAPTVSVVVPAYQAERWIAETVDSILAQSRPAEEVIVVDDGSTDGTAAVLARFGDAIRVVRQANAGTPGALNTGFRLARGEFVAMCGADDLWRRSKLEWQAEAIAANPGADVLFGHATLTGLVEGEHSRPPGAGMLEPAPLRNALARGCVICAPSSLLRRSLFERLGPFVEGSAAEDYEYWFRCLRAGARFYYDPRPLLSWRQHEDSRHRRRASVDEAAYAVLRRYEDDFADRAALARGCAEVSFRAARRMVDDGRPREARRRFLANLRHARGQALVVSARAATWVAILSLPAGARDRLGRVSVRFSRAIDELLGVRRPAPS